MATKRHRVFVSYSGIGGSVASALQVFLLQYFGKHSIDVFVASRGIRTGAVFASAIQQALETADFGVVCLTPQDSGWAHYEMGYLTGAKRPVFPLAFGVPRSGPEKDALQHAMYSKRTVASLLDTIRQHLPPRARPRLDGLSSFRRLHAEATALEKMVDRFAAVDASVARCRSVPLFGEHVDKLAQFYEVGTDLSAAVDYSEAEQGLQEYLEALSRRQFRFIGTSRVADRWAALLNRGSSRRDALGLVSIDGVDFWTKFFSRSADAWQRQYHTAIKRYRGPRERVLIMTRDDVASAVRSNWLGIVEQMFERYGKEFVVKLVTERRVGGRYDFCVVGEWAVSEFMTTSRQVYGIKHFFDVNDIAQRLERWREVRFQADRVGSVRDARLWLESKEQAWT